MSENKNQAATIERLLRRLDDFGTIPHLALKIDRVLSDPECDLAEVAQSIEQEPMLAARIVRMSRSPIFDTGNQTRTVREAVMRIGTIQVQRIIRTVSIMSALPDLPPPCSIIDFWKMGLGTALSARKLSEDLELASPETAYLAGLVHLIGEAFLASCHTQRFSKAVDTANKNHVSLEAALEAEFGVSHPDLTARILETWGFDDEIVEAVRHHLEPSDAGEHQQLATVVLCADRICRDLQFDALDPGQEDTAWIETLPSSAVESLAELGYPDLTWNLIEHREFLREVDETVRATFGEK